MAPKPKSIADYVDGVHYILNISSRLVVVGTGLVANAEPDTFKLKVSPESPSLEEQVRARPKFAMFAVAAAASSNTLHPPSQPPQTSSSGQPSSDLPLQPPQPPQTSSSTGQSASNALEQPQPPQTASSSAQPSSSAEPSLEPEPQRRRLLTSEELQAFRRANWFQCMTCFACAGEPAAGIALVKCTGCDSLFCNVHCERRDSCPHESCLTGDNDADDEAGAGRGCQCACCQKPRTSYLRRALTATAARATALVWSGQVKGGWIITLSLAVEGRGTFQIAVISLRVFDTHMPW